MYSLKKNNQQASFCKITLIIIPEPHLADQLVEHKNRRALGFIQYEKKNGRITIANVCIQLPINSLTIGFLIKNAHAA
jgi:hypothetical protein